MVEDKTVFEALQLLQNKTIDDVILETVLLYDSIEECLVISLPNIKISSFWKYLTYKNACIQIFGFANKFSDANARKKNSFCLSKNLNDDHICTMRFVCINNKDFKRMSPWIVTHIKKLFFY